MYIVSKAINYTYAKFHAFIKRLTIDVIFRLQSFTVTDDIVYIYLFRPIMFVGPTGTGKSVYVQDKMMNGLEKDKYLPAFVNFSAQTSANQTQVEYKEIFSHALL